MIDEHTKSLLSLPQQKYYVRKFTVQCSVQYVNSTTVQKKRIYILEMVPKQNMLPLTLCVLGLALVAGHKLDGAQFGSKSSYFTVGNFDDSSLQVIRNS